MKTEYQTNFVAAFITTHGRIFRKDIMSHLGVSGHQATIILRKFQEKHPKQIYYNVIFKCYLALPHSALMTKEEAQSYLSAIETVFNKTLFSRSENEDSGE